LPPKAKLPREVVDAVVDEAAKSPIGFAVREEKDAVCLAARDGDYVYSGVAPTITSWKTLEHWDPVMERNFARLDNWVTTKTLTKTYRPRPARPVDPEEQKLLDAIVAAPKKDDARLVYADWLIEQGDARGELIALQVRMEKLKDPERGMLLQRSQRIARVNPTVLGPLHGEMITWSRGFVVAARLSPQKILQPGTFVRQPLIDDLTIECTVRSPAAKLAGTKLLAGVKKLTLLIPDATASAWVSILKTMDLSSLTMLSFWNFEWRHATALYANPSLAGKKNLILMGLNGAITRDLEGAEGPRRRAELKQHGWTVVDD
jgi:uncharacterized protein (TIGR02996 family)